MYGQHELKHEIIDSEQFSEYSVEHFGGLMVLIDERWSSTCIELSRRKTQKDRNPNNPHNLKTICESNLHYLLCDKMKTSTDQLG